MGNRRTRGRRFDFQRFFKLVLGSKDAPFSSLSRKTKISKLADIAQNLQQDAVCEIREIVAPRFKRPSLAVKLFSKEIKGLYDTGADVSCLNEKIFRTIPVDARPKKIPGNSAVCRSASGSALSISGKYLIPIEIGRKKFLHEFLIVKNLEENLILGIDFILKNRLNFDTLKIPLEGTKELVFWDR